MAFTAKVHLKTFLARKLDVIIISKISLERKILLVVKI